MKIKLASITESIEIMQMHLLVVVPLLVVLSLLPVGLLLLHVLIDGVALLEQHRAGGDVIAGGAVATRADRAGVVGRGWL